MQYAYTRIDPILESVPQNTDLLHDPVVQKTALWFARFFVGIAAIGIVLYALTLVLRIIAGLFTAIIDVIHATGRVINVFIAPLQHAHPATQLIIIVVVLALGYVALRYIIFGRKRGAA